MFAALASGDASVFYATTTADFEAHENGVRYTRESLWTAVAERRASGTEFVWRVTDCDVHVDGATSRIAYVNRGGVHTSDGSWEERTFAEWVDIVWEREGWRVRFLSSTLTRTST